MYDAFISYRRDGGSETARLVKSQLEARGRRPFLDVDELRTGVFDDRLLSTIAQAANFVLILSPGALDRCLSPEDWLTREIAHALAERRNVIPVFKDGFVFPPADLLPPELRELPRYNGLPFNHVFFSAFADLLVDRMVGGGDGGDQPSSGVTAAPTKAARRPIDLAAEGAAYADRGMQSLAAGRAEEAQSYFERSIVCEPNDRAYCLSAVAMALGGAPRAAIADRLAEALRLDPGNAQAGVYTRELAALDARRPPGSTGSDAESAAASPAAAADDVRRLGLRWVARGIELVRPTTFFEAKCPGRFRARAYAYWAVLAVGYFAARAAVSHAIGVSYDPAVLALQAAAACLALAFVHTLARFYHDLYYPLKNCLVPASRERFRTWYPTQVDRSLDAAPPERAAAFRRHRSAIVLFGPCMVLGLAAACARMAAAAGGPVAARALAAADWAVLCGFCAYPSWLAITAFLTFREYASFTLRPLVTRLHALALGRVSEMVVACGAVMVAAHACFAAAAALAFRPDPLFDVPLAVSGPLATALWTVALPRFLSRAFKQSKARVAVDYAKHVDDAFEEFVESPSEESLKRYRWLADSGRAVSDVRTSFLGAGALAWTLVLNLSAVAIALIYLWWKFMK